MIVEELLSGLDPASHWECPCGNEDPKSDATTTPVRTMVSLREPRCPFCHREYRPEYRIPIEETSA